MNAFYASFFFKTTLRDFESMLQGAVPDIFQLQLGFSPNNTKLVTLDSAFDALGSGSNLITFRKKTSLKTVSCIFSRKVDKIFQTNYFSPINVFIQTNFSQYFYFAPTLFDQSSLRWLCPINVKIISEKGYFKNCWNWFWWLSFFFPQYV